jgi:hypothetical protein
MSLLDVIVIISGNEHSIACRLRECQQSRSSSLARLYPALKILQRSIQRAGR